MKFNIDNFQINKTSEVYIVAEIGINHNGDIEIAKELIKVAKNAGCNAVKFQKRTPELAVPKSQWKEMKETPWGLMPYLEYKKKIEFDLKELDIDWFASAWDIESLNFFFSIIIN